MGLSLGQTWRSLVSYRVLLGCVLGVSNEGVLLSGMKRNQGNVKKWAGSRPTAAFLRPHT